MMDAGEQVMANRNRSCVWRIQRALPRAVFAFLAFLALPALSPSNAASHGQSHAKTRRASKGSICGNPKVACKTSVPFQPHDLPFRVPDNAVIIDTELFYAIILKSLSTTEDDCTVFVPEAERTATQTLFPDHKVFSSRCADPGAPEAGMLFYTTVEPKFRIMAVYAGATIAEARRVLGAVKKTGKFPTAYVRRMRTGFNGT